MILHSMWALAPDLAMLVTALWILIDDLMQPNNPRQSVRTAVVGSLASFFLVLALTHGAPLTELHPYLQKVLVVDGMALFFKGLIALLTAMAALLSYRAFDDEARHHAEYYAMLAFVALGEMLAVSASEFLTFFMCFELLSLPLYMLAGFRRYDSRSAEAGLKYFLTGALSSALLLYGFSWIYGSLSTTVFSELAAHLSRPMPATHGVVVGMVLVMVGLGFKISAAPFHNWAPDVYEGAPSAVVAYLSTAPKAAMAAVLMRLFWLSLGTPTAFYNLPLDWTTLFSILALISMTVGNLGALPQTGLPRMLAYSGIAHIGYLMLGLAACASSEAGGLGRAAVMYYTAAYSFANLAGWAVVTICEQHGIRPDLEGLAGLARRHSFLGLSLMISFMSLAGVPPLAGFVGKFYLFRAAIQARLPLLVLIGILLSVVSLFYYFRFLRVAYFLEPPAESKPLHLTFRQWVVLLACLLASTVVGLWPGLAQWCLQAGL